jgi:hypothetical protein
VAILGHVVNTPGAKWGAATLLSILLIVSGLCVSAAGRADDTLTVGRQSFTKATETYIADSFCLPDLTVQSLGTMFDSEPGGIIGADYPGRSPSRTATCCGRSKTHASERRPAPGTSTTSGCSK